MSHSYCHLFMVVICALCLTASRATSTINEPDSRGPFDRPSGTVENDILNGQVDTSAAKTDSIRPITDGVNSGFPTPNQLAYLQHLGYIAPMPSLNEMFAYEPTHRYYDNTIKSASQKREDPDSKGQFRLRFGRSGVRLRYGRSDPPTLRFG